MLSANRIALYSIALIVTLASVGCASTKPEAAVAPLPAEAAAPSTPTAPVSVETETIVVVEAQAPLDPLSDAQGALAKRSVYFDFETWNVKSEYYPLLGAHGDYLNTHQARNIVVEGNCDERGSREYNLGLGQRRADAVKQRLLLLGTLDNQVETISLGKEKPHALGHDEAAWSENRRADIVYQ